MRALGALRAGVDCAGHEFLTGTRFAVDHDRGVAASDPIDQAEDLFHGTRSTHHLAVASFRLFSQIGVLHPKRLILPTESKALGPIAQDPVHLYAELLGGERLGYEVHGTVLHG